MLDTPLENVMRKRPYDGGIRCSDTLFGMDGRQMDEYGV